MRSDAPRRDCRSRQPGRLLPAQGLDVTGYDAVALCAGPGGFDEANVILGSPLRILGVDLDADACATAVAAGHDRVLMDIRDITPQLLAPVKGVILTPPCPTFSASGTRSGLADYQHILDSITAAGSLLCGDTCLCWRGVDTQVADPRSALVAHCMAVLIRSRHLDWFAAEQVPAVVDAWEDAFYELTAGDVDWDELGDPDSGFDWNAPHDFGWAGVDVEILDALEFGAVSRRRRAFMWGRHAEPAPGLGAPDLPDPAPSVAQFLGWPAGEAIRTRGSRKPTGGNVFSADGPSWCLTGKARSWVRDSDGTRLTAAQAGALNGFPLDYPWQGSRTSQFRQIGDVVNPLVGAAVLGAALDMNPGEVAARIAAAAPHPAGAALEVDAA